MLNQDSKWIYDQLSSNGYDVGTEEHFSELLANEVDSKWIYDESTKLGLDLGDYDHFKGLVNPEEKRKLFPNASWDNLSWDNIKKSFEEGNIAGEVSQVAQNKAEEDIKKAEQERIRQEKINLGITDKDKQDVIELIELEQKAASPVSVSANGIIEVNTPEPVLNQYGMPTNVTKPVNPDVERQVETKKAQMPTYLTRGENTTMDIVQNAYDRAMNTEEGKNIVTSIENKYKTEFKQSEEYKALLKDFYAGKVTEADINNAFVEQYGQKMNDDIREGILGENGLMREYYDDAQAKLDAKLRETEAFDISSRIKAERDRQYEAFQNSIKSKRDDNGINISVNIDAFKPDRMLNHTEQFNNDALDLIDAVEKERGFGKGIGNALVDIDTYTALAELSRTKELVDILDKVDGDEALSEREELMLDAALNYFAVSSYYGDKLGRWYKAGQTTGASLPFIVQFMVTSGALAGAEAAVEGGAKSVGKRIAKNLVKHGYKKFAKALSSKAVTIPLAMLGGLAETGIEAGVMTAVFGLPQIEAGTQRRMLGHVKTGYNPETGKLEYLGREKQQTEEEARKNAMIDTYAEYLSEMVLTKTFSPLTDYIGTAKWFKDFQRNDVVGTIVDIWNNPTWKSARAATKFGSLPEEDLEEQVGGWMRLAFASDVNTMEEAGLDLDSQIDIVLGLAPTSLVFGGIGTASYYGGLRRNAKYIKQSLSSDAQRELFDKLMEESRSGQFGDLAHDMIRNIVLDNEMSMEDKKTNITSIVAEYQELLSKETQELAKQINKTENAANIDEFISNTRNGATDYIYQTIDSKGRVCYIVDGEIGLSKSEDGLYRIDQPKKSRNVKVRYRMADGSFTEPFELSTAQLTAPVNAMNTEKFKDLELAKSLAKTTGEKTFEYDGVVYDTETGIKLGSKEEYTKKQEELQKKKEEENKDKEPVVSTRPHKIHGVFTVNLNGEEVTMKVFSRNATQKKDGSIKGGTFSISVDGKVVTGERREALVEALSNKFKEDHAKALEDYKQRKEEQVEPQQPVEPLAQEPLLSDEDRAKAALESEKRAILENLPRNKQIGTVQTSKLSPEQLFVYFEDKQKSTELAAKALGSKINGLLNKISSLNPEEDIDKIDELQNEIEAYEAAIVKYAGQEMLDKINAARAKALQLDTPPVQEGAPVVAQVVEQEQGETPPTAEPTVAPEEDATQDEVPAGPDTTLLPPAEPTQETTGEGGEVDNEEDEDVAGQEREPIDLSSDDIVFVRDDWRVDIARRGENGELRYVDSGKKVGKSWHVMKNKFLVYYNGIPCYALTTAGSEKAFPNNVNIAAQDYTGHKVKVSKWTLKDAEGNKKFMTGAEKQEKNIRENYKSLDDFMNEVVYANPKTGIVLTLGELLAIPAVQTNKGQRGKPVYAFQVEQFLNKNASSEDRAAILKEIKHRISEIAGTWNAYVRINNLTDVVTEDNMTDFYQSMKQAGGYKSNGLKIQTQDFEALNSNDITKNPILQMLVMLDQAKELNKFSGNVNMMSVDKLSSIRQGVSKASNMSNEDILQEMEDIRKDRAIKNDNSIASKRYNELKRELKKRTDAADNANVENTEEKPAASANNDEAEMQLNNLATLRQTRNDAISAGDTNAANSIQALIATVEEELKAKGIEYPADVLPTTEQPAAQQTQDVDADSLREEYNRIQSDLNEFVYETDEDIDAANARLAEIKEQLQSMGEFMIGGVVEGSASEEAHDVAMAAVMEVLGNNEDIEVITEADELVDEMLEEEGVERSVVTDEELLDELNNGKTIKVYRAMQLVDGRLYPPMSGLVKEEETGKKQWRTPIELGVWEQSEERPDLAIPVIDKKTGKQAVDKNGNLKWKFNLNKTENSKDDVPAAYNPYIHTSTTPLNDQFSSAQSRPELVTVEVEVPESELTSGYKAEKAKDSVGLVEWKAGVVQAKLSGTRTVILSRYDKPIRIVPESEVADVIVDMIGGKDVTFPSNVVTPQLRAELEARGVKFIETDNSGRPVAEMFKAGSVVYGWAKDGKIYLTKAGFNLNTPVHEYTHLWAKAMQKHNPKAWKSIVEQLKKADALWDEVVNDPNYENIKGNDDAIASEVLSRYSDKNGSAKLETEAERVVTEYKGMEKGLKVKALISRVKKALEKFWSWVGKDLFKIESFESVESIADRVLYDMLNNTKLNLDNSKKSSTFAENNENYGRTDEFRELQERSVGLSQSRISEFHSGERKLSDEDRRRVGGVFQRLMESERNGGRNGKWINLTGKGNQFKIAQVNPAIFHDIFQICRNYLPNGELVDLHDNYADCKCFISEDGLCGFAIEPNGNLISVFSLNPSDKKGFLYAIKDLIRQEGATHLDCFVSNKQPLAEIYQKALGFYVASEMDYNMEYDHDNIAENHGMPKVAFMVDKPTEKREFDGESYDAAYDYQQSQTSTAEREHIIAEAKANGTFMTAPNGQPTNLTEDQWVATRTQAFKDYFGDWQNDPANASVVLDENGEPLVVYHGSRMAGFDKFGRGEARDSQGIYTTPNRRAAESYATSKEEWKSGQTMPEAELGVPDHHGVYSLFVNMRNPKVIDFGGKEFDRFGTPKYEVATNEAIDNGERGILFDALEEAEAYIAEHPEEDLDYVEKYTTSDDLLVQAKEEGYDGVIFTNIIDSRYRDPITNYVPFEPNQVKSATQNVGTFNSGDDRIEFMIGPSAPAGSPLDPMLFDAEAAAKIQIKTHKLLTTFANLKASLPEEFSAMRELVATSLDRTEGIRWMMESIEKFRKEHGMPELGEGFDVRTMVEAMDSKIQNDTQAYINTSEKQLRKNISKLAKRVEESSFYKSHKKEREPDQNGNEVILTPLQIIERYLIACDSIEREKLNGNPRGLADFYRRMGMDVYEFAEAFNSAFFSSSKGKQQFDELWDSIRACTNVSIDMGWQSGLISFEEYTEYKKRRYYVPERDFAEVENNEELAIDSHGYRGRSSNKLTAMKQAKGGDSLAANVLANICLHARDGIIKSHRNVVKKAMFDLLKANEEWCREYKVPIPKQVWYQKNEDGTVSRMVDGPSAEDRKLMADLKSQIRDIENEIINLQQLADAATDESVKEAYENDIADLREQIDMLTDMFPYLDEFDTRSFIFMTNAAKNESTVMVYVDGVAQEMIFPNMSIIAKALNGTYNKEGEVGIAKSVGQYFAAGLTVYNPAFFTVNIVRDVPFIMKKGFAEYGFTFGARFIARMAEKLFNRELWKVVWNSDYKSLKDEHLREFFAGGANTGYTTIPEIRELKKQTKKWNDKKIIEWSDVKDLLSYMNTFSEVWTRSAAYSVVRDMGHTNEEAIQAAKNLSVNFNRKGLGNPFMNFFGSLSIFMNAAIQGACGYWRAFKGNEDTLPLRVWHGTRAAMQFMLLPAFTGFISTLLNPDDDKEKLYYSDYDRDNYALLGFLHEGIRIPLSEQVKPFWCMGVNIALGMQGRRTKEQITNSMVSTVVTNLLPLPPVLNSTIVMAANGLTGQKDFTPFQVVENMITPQALSGIYDLSNNVNFMGTDIRIEAGDKPQYMLGENEEYFCRQVAWWAYLISGGNRDYPSRTTTDGDKIWADWNPKQVSAVRNMLVPSTYRDVTDFFTRVVINAAYPDNPYHGEEAKWEDFATVRRFYKPRDREMGMYSITKDARAIVKANNERKANAQKLVKGGAITKNNAMRDEAELRLRQTLSNRDVRKMSKFLTIYEQLSIRENAKEHNLTEEQFMQALRKENPSAYNILIHNQNVKREDAANELLKLTRKYKSISIEDMTLLEAFGVEE